MGASNGRDHDEMPLISHAISMGIDVASDADFDCLLNVAYHINCRLCGGSDVWFKHNAWIADRPETEKGKAPRTAARAE